MRSAAGKGSLGQLAKAVGGARSYIIERVAPLEARFYQPGISYDAKTGMTFDGQNLDFYSGAFSGARRISAASKESQHLMLLAKAVQGEEAAVGLIGGGDAALAKSRALEVLEAKIGSFETFNREFPGFGGFYPWFEVREDGHVVPAPEWEQRLPGLDNGQLAWDVYHASNVLREQGHGALAARYGAHHDLMKRNVVRIFFDPEAGLLRGETRLAEPASVGPHENSYSTNIAGYHLNDAHEGMLLNHYADLFGEWGVYNPNALWRRPHRVPALYDAQGERLTVQQGHWFSAHEDWGFMVLPFRDASGLANDTFVNSQKARAAFSADGNYRGLFASTHRPQTAPGELQYVSALGMAQVALMPTVPNTIIAPYATFPLALADKDVFATWLKTTLEVPRASSAAGMVDSVSTSGDAYAPLLTWDGKALPMLAWMDGSVDDMRRFLKADGLYDRFIARVRGDYSAFEGRPIHGVDAPFRLPSPTARP